MNNITKQRIYGLDFARIIFALSIVLYHSSTIDIRILKSGYLAVECFFIISGFFLAELFTKMSKSFSDLTDSIPQMIKKRFYRLYPQYVFITFVVMIFFHKLFSTSLEGLGYNLIMFGHIGTVYNITPGSWFVGALFWGSVIYIGLFTAFKEKTFYIVSPLLFIFSTTILFNTNPTSLMRASDMPIVFLSSGILRSLAGLSVGIFVYYLANNNNVVAYVKSIKRPVAFFIFTVSVAAIFYLFGVKDSKIIYNIYFPMIPFLLFMATYPNAGNSIFNTNPIKTLSDVSYMLYLTNIPTLSLLKDLGILKISPCFRVIVAVLACIAFALICYHAQKWLFVKLKNAIIVLPPPK